MRLSFSKLLWFGVLVLIGLSAIASYYRFVVLHDYSAGFEIECDPTINSCFVGCENDDCSEVYYYAYMTRDANELYTLCGPNILSCDIAYSCENAVGTCEVEYCDSAIEDNECDDT